MPITNQILYLGPDDLIENRADSVTYQFSEFREHDYFWIEFGRWDFLKNLNKAIPPDIMKEIKEGKKVLALHHSHEGNIDIIESIYKNAVIDLEIPEDCIHIYTESVTNRQVMFKVAEELGKKPIRIFHVSGFERFAKDGIAYMVKQFPALRFRTLEPRKYHRKFLCFNRRWRWHRPLLVAYLHLENLTSQGYISLGQCEEHGSWEDMWHIMLQTHAFHPEHRQYILDNKDKILSMPHFYLDQKDLNINHVHLMPTTVNLYRNTYFSVVTETNFFYKQEPALFLTEKIFKPIAHKHPYIVLGRPKTLSLMRDLGYKTFAGLIDESYDNEEDDLLRLLKIKNEIKRLCALNQAKLNNFLEEARAICDYNYNVLINKKLFVREITNDTRY